ncbi:MAG: hypothetical protein KF750_10750 [Xanthobacteraceae bacterium]|nr:hypothetical protein [Xanthobacteraceae bacterium]
MEDSVTLYLGLKPGERADLEVVGFATAAFGEAVKEIAFILDPGLEIRLEFESATEGSLKLKAILRPLKTPEGRKGALIAIISTVLLTLVADLRTYTVGKLLDRMLTTEQRQQLTDDDIERIARAVKGVENGKIAKEPVRELYKQLARDEAIESVGAITKAEDKPQSPVPRSEFPKKAGIVKEVETSPKTRTKPSTERLTLISPVLLLAQRAWKFRDSYGNEHSYVMADEKFLAQIFLGRTRLSMKQNIQITANIETQEELIEDVWTPHRRFIVKVVRIHKRAPKQSDLFDKPKKKRARRKKKG